MVVTLSMFITMCYLRYPVTFVYKNFMQLACTSIVFSFILSVVLLAKSAFAGAKQLVPENNTGKIFLFNLFLPGNCYSHFMTKDLVDILRNSYFHSISNCLSQNEPLKVTSFYIDNGVHSEQNVSQTIM